MLSGSIAVLFLVGLFSPGQSTTTLAPSPSVNMSPSAMPDQTTNAGPSSTMLPVVQTSQTSTSTPPPKTTTPGAPPPSSTPGTSMATSAGAPSPSSTPGTSMATSTSVITPEKPSCVTVSFIAERAWNASLLESQSAPYNETSEEISKAIKNLFSESSKHQDVEVSEQKYSEKDGVTFVKVKLCLVVKTSDGTLIHDVIIDKVKSGYLAEGFKVKKDSFEFNPLGVEFKDWKAKDGECDKCDGAAGEFTIEGTCVPKDRSCKGVKNTKMTDDCVTYCDSSAGSYTAVSFLILAMGIFFSFR
ncbi:putative uncharacterized protein DDB_G0290521 isoform X2 [Orbicella faveolata]|uniref:putative uncharacterized protein DDB_G0290521 isoform X2 n=1 Tax=Orbicella faveolata TaxID=48498 RepID=UPI0009E46C9E|nr:putative uncharacterized protein DDB_G0290521 isoform X2 [Orbicella faveolata]